MPQTLSVRITRMSSSIFKTVGNSNILNTTQNFTKKELKTRYAESFIGSLWIVIYPLVFSLITAGVFSIFFKIANQDTPFLFYILIGFNSWFWFSKTITRSARALTSNRDLIINNKFPSESIIFSIALVSSIDFLVNISVTLILLSFFHTSVTILGLLSVCFLALMQLIFQTGISLVVSSVNVYFRDLENVVDIVLQLFFYLTPVIYTLDIVTPNLAAIIKLNPMTHLINTYRASIMTSNITFKDILIFLPISVITFILSYLIFKKLEKKNAELL